MSRSDGLTHLDEKGAAHMVDVGDKAETRRAATAAGRIVMNAETFSRLMAGDTPKGDVFATARIAGIMAAKKTHELIPLCHPLALSSISIDLTPDPEAPAVEISATVKLKGQTGVEMEALTAVSVAALTLYDMLKALDKGMRIENIRLVAKEGGKSGEFRAC